MARYGSSRGGYPRPAAPGSARSTTLFAYVRAWAAGIIVLLVTETLQMTLVYDTLVDGEGTRTFGRALLLVHLPNLVCVALATWAAARAHPEPESELPLRHAIAAFAAPVAAQLLLVSMLWGSTGFDLVGLSLSTGVLLAGCAVGWGVDRWLRQRQG